MNILDESVLGKQNFKDVHTEHCCIIHGCKYGEDQEEESPFDNTSIIGCTVLAKRSRQSNVCERCCNEGVYNLHTLARTLENEKEDTFVYQSVEELVAEVCNKVKAAPPYPGTNSYLIYLPKTTTKDTDPGSTFNKTSYKFYGLLYFTEDLHVWTTLIEKLHKNGFVNERDFFVFEAKQPSISIETKVIVHT